MKKQFLLFLLIIACSIQSMLPNKDGFVTINNEQFHITQVIEKAKKEQTPTSLFFKRTVTTYFAYHQLQSFKNLLTAQESDLLLFRNNLFYVCKTDYGTEKLMQDNNAYPLTYLILGTDQNPNSRPLRLDFS